MMRASRLLQFAGIVVVGVGLIYGVAKNDMTSELIFVVIGVALFAMGRMAAR